MADALGIICVHTGSQKIQQGETGFLWVVIFQLQTLFSIVKPKNIVWKQFNTDINMTSCWGPT